MHVVQVNYVFDPSLEPEALLERYAALADWSEALLAAGAGRVSVVQRAARDAELRRRGVDYRFRADGGSPSPGPLLWPRRTHACAAAFDADVVHAHGLIFPVQLGLLRSRLPRRAAVVVQDHAALPPRLRGPLAPLRRAAWRAGLRGADAFFFTAGAQAQPWREAGLIARGQDVHEVLEASRSLRPPPTPPARLPGRPALLWVGRLNANKDPLTVLAGLERALPALPEAQITMAFTEGELLDAVRARSAAPGLDGRVHLRGAVAPERMPALLAAADLFVLGSHHEGSGYALLEALACGLVPVVTDIPSFRAITAGGRIGALWPTGDARALAEALARVAAGDLEALRRGAAAHFRDELSWPAVGRRALAAYRAVLEKRRGR